MKILLTSTSRNRISKAKADELYAIASNPTTDAKTLWELSDCPSIFVRSAVACNPNTPIKLLAKMVDDGTDSWTSVPYNPNCPERLLKKIFKEHPYAKNTYIGIASNPNVSEDLLAEIIKVSDNQIRLAALDNPNVTDVIVAKLAEDRYSDVRAKAKSKLNLFYFPFNSYTLYPQLYTGSQPSANNSDSDCIPLYPNWWNILFVIYFVPLDHIIIGGLSFTNFI